MDDMPRPILIADIELQIDPLNSTTCLDTQAQFEGVIVAIAIIIEARENSDIGGDQIVRITWVEPTASWLDIRT